MRTLIDENELGLIRDKLKLKLKFHLQKIILFGSQATNKADEKSDIDLLVISHFHGKRRQLMVEMNRIMDNVEHAIDLLILTPGEFNREKKIPGTLARYAGEHGRIIYEQPS